MTKYEILQRKMRIFRTMLTDEAARNVRLQNLLESANPLFDAIERQAVQPPQEGMFSAPFRIDDTEYGYPHPLFSAASDFICALEDWPSKSWWTGPKDYGSET